MVTLLTGSVLYVIKKTASKELLAVVFHLDKGYLLLSLFSMFMYHTFDNLRFTILSRTLGIRYSLAYGYAVSYVSTFGATITPGQMGGEFFSAYMLSRKGGRLHNVMSVVTVKSLTGGLVFLLLSPFFVYALLQNPSTSYKILYTLAFFFLLIAAFYFVLRYLIRKNSSSQGGFWLRLKHTLKRYFVVLRSILREKRSSVVLALLFSIGAYASLMFAGALLVESLNPSSRLLDIIEHQLMLMFAVYTSPTPGGSGVGEIGALYVFEPFIDVALLGGLALLWRFVTQYMGALAGGLVFLFIILKDSRRWRRA